MKNQLSIQELKNMLELRKQGEEDFLLVDVRELDEFETKHIMGTDYLIPMSDFDNNIKVLDEYKDKKIVLYCRASRRSLVAQKRMFELGYNNVYNMLVGIIGYDGETK
ncbi:rhodanese-like domain-containing protein [Arcobacter sp. FWKO B]|uniref:rhodanese-like domain-containing protein n=1 Tax=Arcobacter sp. FWKO B TaxID=2593672 RepID=UPI0018A5D863|nr:rhodanese-like domain-containing protein [Arcobacter sp. FWKO B]QOG12974.1 rhodanese-like domain-containing protein [Arcobacter sp. FWKO B]